MTVGADCLLRQGHQTTRAVLGTEARMRVRCSSRVRWMRRHGSVTCRSLLDAPAAVRTVSRGASKGCGPRTNRDRGEVQESRFLWAVWFDPPVARTGGEIQGRRCDSRRYGGHTGKPWMLRNRDLQQRLKRMTRLTLVHSTSACPHLDHAAPSVLSQPPVPVGSDCLWCVGGHI
jgi:hypothetical protein